MIRNYVMILDPSQSAYDIARKLRSDFEILLKVYLENRIQREAAKLIRDGNSHWLSVLLPERIQASLGNGNDGALFSREVGRIHGQTVLAGFVAVLQVDRPRSLRSYLMEREIVFSLSGGNQIEIGIFDGGNRDEELMSLWLSKLNP